MELGIKEGILLADRFVVRADMSAKSVGSGDLEVLATPTLIAMLENVAMRVVADLLPEGSTTVGGYVELSHLKPTPVGAEVIVEARLEKVMERKLHFKLIATEGGTTIGDGTHIRFIVDRLKFIGKMS